MQRLTTGDASSASAGNVNSDARTKIESSFDIFWEAMDVVNRDFYGDLPTAQDTTYLAIRGVVDSLGDPHTSFLTPSEAERFQSNITGNFEGIGARVEWDEKEEAVRIVEPYENQPAWNAGLRRDDLVIAIDGQSTQGSDLEKSIDKIRGPKGSTVTLRIRRQAVVDPFDVVVARDRIDIPTIETNSLGPNGEIGYVKLFTFNENAGQLVRQAVQDAVNRKPKALILDLRGNSGGLLREAVKVTNVFIEESTVVIERFKDKRIDTYKTEEKAASAVSGWQELAQQNYDISDTQTLTAAGQEYTVIQFAYQDKSNPYAFGVAAFGQKGTSAIEWELSCQESYTGDALAVLTEFLNGCTY